MGRPIINGTLGPVRQGIEYVFDPLAGQRILARWESAGNQLLGIAASCRAGRIGYNLTSSPAKSVLIAEMSGPESGQDDVITDTWSLLANEIQKDLREHPRAAALSKAVMSQINAGILAGTDPAQMVPALSGDAATLYDLLSRGTTHYALGQYVLKHSTNVSNQYSANVADTNVECIYATAQLVAEATNANSWTYPLPGRMKYKIEHLKEPTARSGYMWGWRKLPSTEQTAANGRLSIDTEYWLEQWSLFIYEAVA